VSVRPYGDGIFRRRFLMRAESGRVVGDMEDDFHRFRVELEHDGEHVRQIRGEAHRHPWTECPGATAALKKLVGMPLSTNPTAAASHTSPRENCTHLFDVASLAVAHAAARRERRQYDIVIPDRREWRTHATLHRDNEPMLAWDVAGTRIEGPAPFEGVEMRGASFIRWTEDQLDPETAEAVLALRRACFIAMGRARDLDAPRLHPRPGAAAGGRGRRCSRPAGDLPMNCTFLKEDRTCGKQASGVRGVIGRGPRQSGRS
jgi:hypothetical protein